MSVTLIGVALIIGLWFGWRLYRQRRLMMFGKHGADETQTAQAPGWDSDLFLIERVLSRTAPARGTSETLAAWLARIHDRLPPGMDATVLARIVKLHYRYRFDPAG